MKTVIARSVSERGSLAVARDSLRNLTNDAGKIRWILQFKSIVCEIASLPLVARNDKKLYLLFFSVRSHSAALPLAAVLIALAQNFMKSNMSDARAKRNFNMAPA